MPYEVHGFPRKFLSCYCRFIKIKCKQGATKNSVFDMIIVGVGRGVGVLENVFAPKMFFAPPK